MLVAFSVLHLACLVDAMPVELEGSRADLQLDSLARNLERLLRLDGPEAPGPVPASKKLRKHGALLTE